MGKRKSRSRISADILEKNPRSAISETLISCKGRRGEEDNGTVPKEGKSGFFACYLLTSLSPRHKGRTYIGFTVNPRRRIRQHNGEIGSGASRTKSARPWEMVFCIYGFPTHVSALQFEWAWQHPRESLAVRDASATFKSLTGLANKIKLGYTMLTLPAWENLNLAVNFFSTKYTKHYAGCPSLPKQMRVQVCSMDELPCYAGIGPSNIYEDEDGCEDDKKCENMNDVYASVREESTGADNWRISEETCNHNGEGIQKDIVSRHSGDFLSSTGGDTQHALFTVALEESSTVTTNTFSALGGSKNNEVVAPIEENNGVEFDQPVRAVDYNEPSILTKVFPCEVEVIDLLSPSPDVRIRFSSRTKKSSDVAPETIDLTKSPIYV